MKQNKRVEKVRGLRVPSGKISHRVRLRTYGVLLLALAAFIAVAAPFHVSRVDAQDTRARFEQDLATGEPLPTDTVEYVTAVTTLLGDGQGKYTALPIRRAIPWREAPLFVERMDAR